MAAAATRRARLPTVCRLRSTRAGVRFCFLQRWGAEAHAAPGFLLIFPVPTDKHLARIRRIHRSKQHRLAESHLSKNERWATTRKTMLPGTLASSYFAAILYVCQVS